MGIAKPTTIWLVMAVLIGLPILIGLDVQALAADDVNRQNTSSNVASRNRASQPRPYQDMKLIGVAVIEGSESYAFFQIGGKSVLVKEGAEIMEGLLLVDVRWGRIDVERQGIVEEIRMGSGEGTPRDQGRQLFHD